MKQKKAFEDLKESNTSELYKKLQEASNKFLNFQFEAARGEIKNHRQIRNKKKQIAQIKTLLRMRAQEAVERKENE